MGNDTQTRQITGVAAGSADSDAANVAQLKSVSYSVSQVNNQFTVVQAQVNDLRRSAYSGIAMGFAMSGTYMPTLEPGERALGVGVGGYKGYGALAINFKELSKDGRWSWGAGIATTGSEWGMNAGVGWKW